MPIITKIIFSFATFFIFCLSYTQSSFGQNFETNPHYLHIPSITFGDLLANFSQADPPNPQQQVNQINETELKKQKIKELIERLETFYQQSSSFSSSSFSFPLPTLTNKETDKQNSVLGRQNSLFNDLLPESSASTSQDNQELELSSKNQFNNLKNSPTPSLSPIHSQPLPVTNSPTKNTYLVALLGDSMVDTLGNNLPHLRKLLEEEYPQYTFALLNYGQGATDITSGLYRLTHGTYYLEQYFPPLLSFKPDILVVESFAYNHWSAEKSDLDKQWLTIAQIIETTKNFSPETKIILAATIAPNPETFGDGVLNWPKNLKWESAMTTKAYLQNFVNFATSQNYPLANAYHASMDNQGNGIKLYINPKDNLHPSNEGALLFSQKILETIKKHQLIK